MCCGGVSAACSQPGRSPRRWSSSPPRGSCAPRTGSRPTAPTGWAWRRSCASPPRPTRPRPRGCSARPRNPQRVGVLAIVGDRGLAGSYNSGVFRATERLVNEHVRNGAEVTLWTVGKKAPSYFRYRGIADRAVVPGHRRPARVRRRPGHRRHGDRPLRGRRDGPGAAGLHPLHLGRHAAGGDAADAAAPPARRGRGRGGGTPTATATADLVGYTEFEPEPAKLLA